MVHRSHLTRATLLALAAATLPACSHRRTPPPPTARAILPAATGPASLRLAEILPPATTLPTPRAASTTRPSLDALTLFAEARDRAARGQRYSALDTLDRALAADPDSAAVRIAIAETLLFGQSTPTSNEIASAGTRLAEALAFTPDDLPSRLLLARVRLEQKSWPDAIAHLRLAILTPAYADPAAAEQALVADFMLARALQQGGYDRAALDTYDRVLDRIRAGGLRPRGRLAGEVASLTSRPGLVFGFIGELYKRNAQPDDALAAYELAARDNPEDFDAQARVVRAMLAAKHPTDAADRAAMLLTRFRADTRSTALLDDVFANDPDGALQCLRTLRQRLPNDRAILFALAARLESAGQPAAALAELSAAASAQPADPELAVRVAAALSRAGKLTAAAAALARAAAAAPDRVSDLAPAWDDLFRDGRPDRLTIAAALRLPLDAPANRARDYLVAREAARRSRPGLERRLLDAANRGGFAPASRLLAVRIAAQVAGNDPARRLAFLNSAAAAAGDPGAAADVRAIARAEAGDLQAAADLLAEARRLGNALPDVRLSQALAGARLGEASRLEQSLWRIASDHPRYADAFLALVSLYRQGGAIDAAERVISVWTAAEADGPGTAARVAQVQFTFEVRNDPPAARKLADPLLARYPDDPAVVAVAELCHRVPGSDTEALAMLGRAAADHPRSTPIAQRLAALYIAAGRRPDALRTLDSTRRAVAGDADLLYPLSALARAAGDPAVSRAILEDAAAADPTHGGAANDLAWDLADSTTADPAAIARAISLARIAVTAEPDTAAAADTLGWAYYKAARFPEAITELTRAAALADADGTVDAGILDHLADAHWRNGTPAAALDTWRRALAAPAQDPTLRLRIQSKLDAAAQSRDPATAPVVGPVTLPNP